MEKEKRKRNELVRAGDLDFVRDLAREPEPEPVTSAQEKLLTAGVEIAQGLPSSADMAFTHAVLSRSVYPGPGWMDASSCGSAVKHGSRCRPESSTKVADRSGSLFPMAPCRVWRWRGFPPSP